MRTLIRLTCSCVVLILGIVQISTSFHSEEFVFETDLVRFVITGEGRNRSLFDKTNKVELLSPEEAPFASAKLKDGRSGNASAIKRDGDALRVEFESLGLVARYKISTSASCILIRLAGIEGLEPQELQLAQLQLSPLASGGSWIVARWNERVVVSMMGLSERVNARLVGPSSIVSSLQSDFGFEDGAVAIIVAPKPDFMKIVRNLEADQNLPYCRLDGKWGKTAADVNTSYLFINMTETNADEVMRYASLGGFRYILIDSSTWSQSIGSYAINSRNYPSGERGLAAIADRCHRAGFKVGLHMMTSLIGINDPLAASAPSMLLKNASVLLANDITDGATEIPASAPIVDFRRDGGVEDIQIGEELVRCARIGATRMDRFLGCTRGIAGTKAAPHKSGEKIQGLWRYDGAYFVDLNTPLMQTVSNRIADLFNRNGLDMIYFDAGELNAANGPFWYWGARQQMDIWSRIRGNLLVQGSEGTPWSWHIFCRYTCDDQSVVAVKQYIDYHKIANRAKFLSNNFMPAELGWWGIFTDGPSNRATTPDEAELMGVRSVALGLPFSLETRVETLRANGRADEMLRMLGRYERLRLSGKVREEVRARLQSGEWHLDNEGSRPLFFPVVYSSRYATIPATITQTNQFQAQSFKFRLAVVPALDKPGSAANKVLCEATTGFMIKPPDSTVPAPGFVAAKFEFVKNAGPQPRSVFLPSAESSPTGGDGTSIDLRGHRALAVTMRIESAAPEPGSPAGVLNIQLEAAGQFRDHYIDLDFTGERTVIIREPSSERLLPEFKQPIYPIKRALIGFDYSTVTAVNVRWMRPMPAGTDAGIAIIRVEALAENDTPLRDPELQVNNERFKVPAELGINDYVEFWGSGPIRIFDRNGNERNRVSQPAHIPKMLNGANTISVKSPISADIRLTAIVLGEPLSP